MRVIAGSAKSIRLQYPKGEKIRPTPDRVRESLFASLGDQVVGSRFCDLYAGAGSVGIEALSRGAQSAVFVEKNSRCLEALRTNLANTHLAELATVFSGSLPKCFTEVWQKLAPFDIVFADPPYSVDIAPLLRIATKLIGAHDTLLIVQCDSRAAPEVAGLRQVRRQQFGGTVLLWYET